MHASQLSVSLLQFTNPFGILTILAFSLFVNNSEKIELWVPLMGPLLRYLGPLLVPFLLKVGSPLGPLFRIFGSPFDCVTVYPRHFQYFHKKVPGKSVCCIRIPHYPKHFKYIQKNCMAKKFFLSALSKALSKCP